MLVHPVRIVRGAGVPAAEAGEELVDDFVVQVLTLQDVLIEGVSQPDQARFNLRCVCLCGTILVY